MKPLPVVSPLTFSCANVKVMLLFWCFPGPGPDGFQPPGSHRHEGGAAAALLPLPAALHSLPPRAREGPDCGEASDV